ncbi:MAG: gamma-glutamyl-gamma-aminobutyrate hydrolase family protein, partial [Bacteroidales bacterium]|nr:gamma-glutamyl-gamma-aminobutyrate hydrolase family protein [Bacteroidales bacterium]
MKHQQIPYIGISGNFNEEQGQHLLAKTYVNAILKAGACPVILPAFPAASSDEAFSQALIDKILAPLDAIVFSGGGDFTPELIGEERIEALGSLNPLRDEFEFPLIRRALDLQMPILGICRGEQLLNLALGGKIYQDLPSEYKADAEGLLQHS